METVLALYTWLFPAVPQRLPVRGRCSEPPVLSPPVPTCPRRCSARPGAGPALEGTRTPGWCVRGPTPNSCSRACGALHRLLSGPAAGLPCGKRNEGIAPRSTNPRQTEASSDLPLASGSGSASVAQFWGARPPQVRKGCGKGNMPELELT